MATKRGSSQGWFVDFHEGLWLRGDETGCDEAAAIKRLLGLRRGQSVLDAPCGAGRIAVHLARAGCKVTGADRMGRFLSRAHRRFLAEKLSGRFLKCDMRELDFRDEFDAVYNVGGSFGYFCDAENLDVLRRFGRALRPAGRVLIDQLNREHVLRHFRPTMHEANLELSTTWDRRGQRVETTWTTTGPGTRRSCRSTIRLYTPSDFRRLFANAALDVQAFYGSLTGEEYRRGSGRIYIVGRKQQF